MRNFEFKKICQELVQDLPSKEKEVILRRFDLKGSSGEKRKKRETLAVIGKDLGVTRERIRQIEKVAILKIKSKLPQYQKVFSYFSQYLKKFGGFRKEEVLLTELAPKEKNQVYFLLMVSKNFERFTENKDFYSFWAIDKNSQKSAQKIIENIFNKFREIGRPLILKEITSFFSLPQPTLLSCLEISKKILKNSEGFYGLEDWPEINPRTIRDKAYFVFKKLNRPLHFKEVAESIEGGLVQTIHNELIKDPRFILVGRGIYALKEWGYSPGRVSDVIAKILKENGPLTKEEILEKVLKERMVKESTILLNLTNKKYFLRDSQGRYQIREI